MEINFNDYVDDFIRLYCANRDNGTKKEYEQMALYIAHVIEHFTREIDHGPQEETGAMKKCDTPLRFPAPPAWPNRVYITKDADYVELNPQGYVIEDLCTWPKKDLLGKHVTEIKELVRAYYISEYQEEIPKDNGLDEAILIHNAQMEEYNCFLNAIMFRLMERNINNQGANLALQFAIEMGADISIPMRFGLDQENENIIDLYRTYQKAGGEMDIECFVNYHSNNKRVIPIFLKRVEKLYYRYIVELYDDMRAKQTSSPIPYHILMQKALAKGLHGKKGLKLKREKSG